MFYIWLDKLKHNKNIIFIDFNWVISYKKFWFSLEKNDKITFEKINKFLFKDNAKIVNDWMLWKYKSSDICKFLSTKLDVDYDYIYESFLNDCINIDLSDWIRDLLYKLKKYYYIVLVTDNMDCFTDFTVNNNLEYFLVFDSIFNSADFWYFKVDSYLDYVNKYNSKIELCYLIDDSKNNCEKFISLWWNAFNLTWEKAAEKRLCELLNSIIWNVCK